MQSKKVLIVNTTLEKWNDIFSLNQEFLKHFIFRGQADADWLLQTSLERMVANHHGDPFFSPSFWEIL